MALAFSFTFEVWFSGLEPDNQLVLRLRDAYHGLKLIYRIEISKQVLN